MTRIAIMGATSQIAKGIIFNLSVFENVELFLFARNLEKLNNFTSGLKNLATLNEKGLKNFPPINERGFNAFEHEEFDAIINCVGFGEPSSLMKNINEVFFVTEKFDNMAIEYLRKSPETVYINLSSGAVYGTNFLEPVNKDSKTVIDPNNYSFEYNYLVAKINAETKHRALGDLNIIDLRVFSYFSRFIDIQGKFLLSECISCIINNTELKTGATDIIRDYIHPKDFTRLIMSCIVKKSNTSYDIISKKPASKFEIFNMLSTQFGFKYKIEGQVVGKTASGLKENYYSLLNRYNELDFRPEYDSLETIYLETKEILDMR